MSSVGVGGDDMKGYPPPPKQVTSHLDGVSRRAVTDIGSGVILQANGGEKRLSLPWACYSLLLDDVEPEREIMCQNLTKLHNN